MSTLAVLLTALALLAFGLLSQSLRGTPLTGPMWFAGLGLALGPVGVGMVDVALSNESMHLLAELTLVVVLFSDASRIDLRSLWRNHGLVIRMLALGMPLTVLLGTGVVRLLLPGLDLWECALVAAILTPTDAALGLPVVEDERVPERIRHTVAAESGLNDGLALPFVLLFGSLAAHGAVEPAAVGLDALVQLVLGPLVGVGLGGGGGLAIRWATERAWMRESAEGLGALALAVGAFSAAELSGGNGFLAAFCAGLAMGTAVGSRCAPLYRFEETEARLLVLLAFGIVGAVLIPDAWPHLVLADLGVALLALTVMRMGPVALSLLGAGLRRPTVLFLGWFGPRGLASILFLLLATDRFELPHQEAIVAAVIATVSLSIVAHGVSAGPLSQVYGAMADEMAEGEAERQRRARPFLAKRG